jgi:hypothetical protein
MRWGTKHQVATVNVEAVKLWPAPARVGMLTYSAAVTLYLAYLGFAGGMNGILLWPAVVLHAVLTLLLARASTSAKETKA